ncbi:MAG: redoxin domain-containing protein [Clostridia bacterium]|nr:redoxin domain-containing protein [Clostridia bacterium]
MKKFSKLLALFLALAMLFAVALPLTSCGGDDECTEHVDADTNGKCDKCDAEVSVTPTPGPNGKATYTVVVQSAGGYALKDVIVTVIDTATGSMIDWQKTDETGTATFNIPVSTTYAARLSQDDLPAGYVAREQYPFAATGTTVIKLSTQLVEDTGLAGVSYQLGDIMHDFTLTDPDGNSHTLSDIFESGKKAVVLNVWYTTCTYCLQEFPSIQEAYELYKDEIEILAINDYAADSALSVKNFKADYEYTFPMMKDTVGLNDAFGFTAAPCSVVIDRYGMISIIEVGAVIGTGYWTKAFAHYTSDEYVQSTYASLYELSPQEKPDKEMPSSDELAAAFNGSDLTVTYKPETDPTDAEFSWPFEIVEFDKEGMDKVTCIRPTNYGKDNSYATLYAEVYLEEGEALLFDYFSSTHNDNTTGSYDVMYVLVDDKDIYSIAGVEKDGWQTACAFVANESRTYEVAFCYIKDSANSAGDDTVYLKSLRAIPKEDIELEEVYIFRQAATEPKADNTGYNDYVSVVLGEDGYYHVGTADGPILLANLIGYTNFDPDSTVTIKLYEADNNYQFMINGENKFNQFEMYCNYASNSQLYGYASVTEELAGYLKAFVQKYALSVGKIPGENTWLELCVYYDSYGTNGEQLEDPIKGLASFSSYEALETLDAENPVYNSVEYNRVIMPRGLLYKFVPTKSGVYRVVSQSKQEVVGWIFQGNHDEWASVGDRKFVADSNAGERLNLDLLVENENGVVERDLTNCSVVAYLEEGVEYYIAIALYETTGTGKFTFTVRYAAEEFDYFREASPGYFTYEEGTDGSVGNMLAGGIDVVLGNDGYYYHKIITDSATGAWEYGSPVYADFIWTTNTFPTKTLTELIETYAFDFSKTAGDIEAIAYYNTYAKLGFSDYWKKETDFESRWTNEYEAEAKLNEPAWREAFEKEWLAANEAVLDNYTEEDITKYKNKAWESYYEEKLEEAKDDLWAAEFELILAENPEIEQIAADLYLGISHDTELAQQYHEYAVAGLKTLWGDDFDGNWSFYAYDDVLDGIFHGTGTDYTAAIREYLDDVLDEAGFPERQGCVQVDEELAQILQMLMDKYTFRNVENSWTKLCYYYEHLGPAAE